MKNNSFNENYDFNLVNWQTDKNSNIIILAIHGYNDYSKAFKAPAEIFSKHGIATYSFDLRGFGTNRSLGDWFELEIHCHDIKKIILDLKSKNPSKKVFLLGESMGAAISISLAKPLNYSINRRIFERKLIWKELFLLLNQMQLKEIFQDLLIKL